MIKHSSKKPTPAQSAFIYAEIAFLIFISLFFSFKQDLYIIRPIIMLLALIYLIWSIKKNNFSFDQLGLNNNNFLPAINQLAIVYFLAMIPMFLLRNFFSSLIDLNNLRLLNNMAVMIVSYIFFSAPIQEFIFSSYLLNRFLQLCKLPALAILLNSFLFALVHLPFNNLFFVLATFAIGIVNGINFLQFRNYYAVAIFHGIIGSSLFLLIF